ncbi:hypothetical protein, partial [Bosea sp. (in: a-proteobacteria)]|uniref:hypothetical protein n=1 Tax=Bosea sp. (in: a-proteobacteria) TaxID=1871050 RepID=UPI00403434D8
FAENKTYLFLKSFLKNNMFFFLQNTIYQNFSPIGQGWPKTQGKTQGLICRSGPGSHQGRAAEGNQGSLILIDGSLQKIKHILQDKYFGKINSCCAVARNLSLHSSLHSSHRAIAQPPLIFLKYFI